jgi:hypothetical protein
MRLTLPNVAGLAAPLIYAATVIVFSRLTPGYSNISDAVSELNLPGAPNRRAVDGAFVLYNLFLILFSLSLRSGFDARGLRISRLGPLFLFLTGLCGVAMTALFPLDPAGSEPTFGGQMHLILAGALSLGSILTVYFFGSSLRRREQAPLLAGYSFLTLAVILVSGAFAGFAAWRHSTVFGLWERVTIGAFLLWLFVLALILVFSRNDDDYDWDDDDDD